MPVFAEEQDVYRHLGRLLLDVAQDDELAERFRRTDTIIQFRFSNPASQITVKMKRGEQAQVDFGPSKLEPEIVMSMEADTAHLFWLGELNLSTALVSGRIKGRGPAGKVLRTLPLIKFVFPLYRERLAARPTDA